jgi:hypothetical protein
MVCMMLSNQPMFHPFDWLVLGIVPHFVNESLHVKQLMFHPLNWDLV